MMQRQHELMLIIAVTFIVYVTVIH